MEPGVSRKAPRQRRAAEAGFTLVEVMISAAVVLIGLLGVLASFGVVMASSQYSREDMIAKQKALEAIESVYTARNTQQITFAQIANQGAGGIFKVGFQPLLAAGADGLLGTGDDVNFPANGPCPAGPECVVLPGPDGVLGTADDVAMSLSNFQRQVQINTVLEADGVTINPNLKQVVVTVQYTRNESGGTRSYTTNALISSYR